MRALPVAVTVAESAGVDGGTVTTSVGRDLSGRTGNHDRTGVRSRNSRASGVRSGQNRPVGGRPGYNYSVRSVPSVTTGVSCVTVSRTTDVTSIAACA